MSQDGTPDIVPDTDNSLEQKTPQTTANPLALWLDLLGNAQEKHRSAIDTVHASREKIEKYIHRAIQPFNTQNGPQKSRRDLAVALETLEQVLHTLFSVERPLAIEHGHGVASLLKKQDEPPQLQQSEPFLEDLQLWIIKVASVYLRQCTPKKKLQVYVFLLQTPYAMSWASSLLDTLPTTPIDTTVMNVYLLRLHLALDHGLYPHGYRPRWTEEDYLAYLDQVDPEAIFMALLGSPNRDTHPLDFGSDIWAREIKRVLLYAHRIITTLLAGVDTLWGDDYTNTTKRLAQMTTRIMNILVTHAHDNNYTTRYQEKLDTLVCGIVRSFVTTTHRRSVCHFLPTIPFSVASSQARWDILQTLVKVDMSSVARSMKNDLDAMPDLSPFLHWLASTPLEGVFILRALSTMATSIPSWQQSASESSSSLILVITRALFVVAFVDRQLSDLYYKDVRDNFGLICTKHPRVISLLLRWTVQNVSVSDGMALYLFRSLPLDQWQASLEDIQLLRHMVNQAPLLPSQVVFVRYVVEHLFLGFLDHGTDPTPSTTQTWLKRKRPFLGHDVHEALAMLLIDLCSRYQRLPEIPDKSDTGQTISHKTEEAKLIVPGSTPASVLDVVEWAWKIVLQLKLYDCPLSTEGQALDKRCTESFVKDFTRNHSDTMALHASLVTYVGFLLSGTSRHFLQFEAHHGWLKLLFLLKRGKPAAVMHALGEVIPVFAYLHGDDVFIDDSLMILVRHMVEYKSDPMLVKVCAARLAKASAWDKTTMTGLDLVMGSNAWHGYMIDHANNLDTSHQGFSYCGLLIHAWLQAVIYKREWMWDERYVSMMDTLCRIAFYLQCVQPVRAVLRAEYERLGKSSTAMIASPSDSSASTDISAAQQQTSRHPLQLFKGILPDSSPSSLLVGEWSMLSLTTQNLISKTPGVEQRSLWFAFQALLLETAAEHTYRFDLAEHYATQEHEDIPATIKMIETKHRKPLEHTAIFRWLQHILLMPPDHTLLPLFFQVFFCLYYGNTLVNSRRVMFGRLFFFKKTDTIAQLRDHIAHLQTYHGQQLVKQGSTKESLHEVDHERLRRLYHAMWLWLGHADLVVGTVSPESLSQHHWPDRLEACMRASNTDGWEAKQPWHDLDALWLDIVDLPRLREAFLAFAWEGSSKHVRSTP